MTEMKVSQLAHQLVDAEGEVNKAKDILKKANEQVRLLKEETIPGLMMELQLTEIKLSTGQKVSIKQDVYATIPASRRVEAFAWLEEHGFGGLIKTDVNVSFARGQKDDAESLMTDLEKEGLIPVLTEKVHSQTLKSFLRDEISKGTAVPLDTFGARPVWTTTVKG